MILGELKKLRELLRERNALRERLRRVEAQIAAQVRADAAGLGCARGRGRRWRRAARGAAGQPG